MGNITRRITGGTFSSALATLLLFSEEPHSAEKLSEEPLTLLRFYSDEPRHQSGEMDTLQIHLFGNLKISIILVAANLLHLLQIRKNDPPKV